MTLLPLLPLLPLPLWLAWAPLGSSFAPFWLLFGVSNRYCQAPPRWQHLLEVPLWPPPPAACVGGASGAHLDASGATFSALLGLFGRALLAFFFFRRSRRVDFAVNAECSTSGTTKI